METNELFGSFSLFCEDIRDQKGSGVNSVLEELKGTISDLYKEAALFVHSDSTQDKIILPYLLNLSKYCEMLESSIAERELSFVNEVERRLQNQLFDDVISNQINIIEEKLDHIVAQSSALNRGMIGLSEQLNLSLSGIHSPTVRNCELSGASDLSDMEITSDVGSKENLTTNRMFMSKLQAISKTVENLDHEIANSHELSVHLISNFSKSLMFKNCEHVSEQNETDSEQLLSKQVTLLSDPYALSELPSKMIEKKDLSFTVREVKERECFDSTEQQCYFSTSLSCAKRKTKGRTSHKDLVVRHVSSHLNLHKNSQRSDENNSINLPRIYSGTSTCFSHQKYLDVLSVPTYQGANNNDMLNKIYHWYLVKLQHIASAIHASPHEMPYLKLRASLLQNYCDNFYSCNLKPVISAINCQQKKLDHHLNSICHFCTGHEYPTVIQEIPFPSSSISVLSSTTFIIEFVKHLIAEKICSDAKLGNLIATIEQLNCAKAELEEKLVQLQKQIMDTIASKEEFRKRADFIISKERSEFRQQISILQDERESLANHVSQLRNEVQNLEKELQHIKHVLLRDRIHQEEDVAALQEKLYSEAMRFEKALKNYTEYEDGLAEMKAQITDQEEIIYTLESAFEGMKAEMAAEKKDQLLELDELRISLTTRDAECSALSEELKRCVAELDEESQRNIFLTSELTDLRVSTHKTISTMEAELNLLKGDSHILRKKLVKLIKEKDMLWKRTDHLTYLQKSQVAGRWMNDREVTHCMGCKHRFSFTLRKHHCRLCGKIFCHSCADNWLLTAASRCESRVCNACYVQHMQIKEVVKDGSSVHEICNGSEEEEVAECPSINCSMVSCSNSALSIGLDSNGHSVNDLSFTSQEENAPLHSTVAAESMCETDTDRNCNFDVITDEEIAKSLSTSSPYNPLLFDSLPQDNQADFGMSLTLTRTITEIEATGEEGIGGELWISAGMRSGIPVLCDVPPADLHWKFICDNKAMTFNVVYKEKDSTEVIVCNSAPKNEGSFMLEKSGCYILQFDNTFSRVKARKVQYTLWVKSVSHSESCM